MLIESIGSLESLVRRCCLLQAVDSTKGTEPGHEAAEGFKELRGGCLRLLAQLWLRFPDAVEWQPLWPAFLALIDRLLPRMEVQMISPCTCTIHARGIGHGSHDSCDLAAVSTFRLHPKSGMPLQWISYVHSCICHSCTKFGSLQG